LKGIFRTAQPPSLSFIIPFRRTLFILLQMKMKFKLLFRNKFNILTTAQIHVKLHMCWEVS